MTEKQESTRRQWLIAGSLIVATFAVAHGLRGANASPNRDGGTTTNTSANGVHVSSRLDREAITDSDRDVRMELILAADKGDKAIRVPTDVIVVLDRSPSMTGDRIRHAKQATIKFIDQLDANDRFALVTYDHSAQTPIPLSNVGNGAKARWKQVVSNISLGSATNIAAGLDAGAAQVAASTDTSRAARVILISDGEANTGDTSPEGLSARATRISDRAPVTSIGVGHGFNEVLMARIAGTGNYYYLEHSSQLASILKDEFESSRETVATQLSVTLSPAAGMKVLSAAGYPLTKTDRSDGSVTFRPGYLFAGQERRIWVTYRATDLTKGRVDVGKTSVSFVQNGEQHRLALAQLPKVNVVRTEGEFLAGLDKEAWERSVSVEEFNALQNDVADSVRKGDRVAAKKAIKRYRDKNEKLNHKMASPVVAASLENLDPLAGLVDDAFTGADQKRKQNVYGKSIGQKARDGRRAGSKRNK